MKHLVIGAGATLAEALAAGISPEDQPPLISNFARKVWHDFNPHPHLDRYLESLGHTVENDDGRELFFDLEEKGSTNIEKFFEFAWRNKGRSWEWSDNPAVNTDAANAASDGISIKEAPLPSGFARGLQVSMASSSDSRVSRGQPSYWDNLMDWGIGRPFVDLMVRAFGQNGGQFGFRDLPVAKMVAAQLAPGDLVLSLNYDTVFEIALEQLGASFTYGPKGEGTIRIAKPHGSLNLVQLDGGYSFGAAHWLGTPEPADGRSFQGFVPPRLNKTYAQHPFAKQIMDSMRGRRPNQLIFWGIGLTESDADLLALYRAWANRAQEVVVVNPDHTAAERIGRLLSCNPRHLVGPEGQQV